MRRTTLSHIVRIAVLIILTLIYALPCAATQNAATQDAKLQPPAKREFKHKAKIKTKYDRFEDQTTVYIEGKRVLGGFLSDLTMGASISYRGQKASLPKDVLIFFKSSNTEDWRFLHDVERELYVLADGERLPLGTMTRTDSTVLTGGRVSEEIGTLISSEQFLKIIQARKVEMKLGRYQFELKEEHLEALRDLASRMAQ